MTSVRVCIVGKKCALCEIEHTLFSLRKDFYDFLERTCMNHFSNCRHGLIRAKNEYFVPEFSRRYFLLGMCPYEKVVASPSESGCAQRLISDG